MEPIAFSHTPGAGFHIDGFPEAAKLLTLQGPKARRLADLCLHKNDLDFAADSLVAINRTADALIRAALWRSAVVHYMKCFGDSASRFQLSAESIYKKEQPEALLAHQFFRDLRNKHVVHDENAYMQSTPTAVLNKPEAPEKIPKIICISMTADVLGQENYANLKLLIDKTHAWVVAQFDELCGILTRELESQPYDTLLKMEDVTQRIPTPDDMAKNRGKAL